MMTNSTYLRVLLVLLLVGVTAGSSITAVAVAASGAASSATAVPTDGADLVVRQESYIGKDVKQSSADGRPVYTARGERLIIVPQNFQADNVVDFGVTTDAGTLDYDSTLGAFIFSPEGEQASFQMYWIVAQQAAATGGNSTGSQQHKYVATIKIAGGVGLAHRPTTEFSQTRQAAANWNEFNSTIQDVRDQDLLLWFGPPPDTETVINGMVATYVTSRDPFRLLSGGLTAVILTLTLTIGGIAWLALREGYAALAMYKLRSKLGLYRSIEHAEAEISERVLALDLQERERAVANKDWNDKYTDTEAAALRELADTPREGLIEAGNRLLPEVWLGDRLKALASFGFVARVTERDADGSIADAELVPPDDVTGNPSADPAPDGGTATAGDGDDGDEGPDGARPDDIVSLGNPSRDLTLALADDPVVIHEFDMGSANIDPETLDSSPTSYTLPELLDEFEIQFQHFDDMAAAGEALHEWIDVIAESPYCEADGTPRPARVALNSLLSSMQWLGDGYDHPTARLMSEYVERVLVEYDPSRESQQVVRDIKHGKDISDISLRREGS